MTFVRCLDCGDTFQHTQTAHHRDEKHPHSFPVHHTAGIAGTSAYPNKEPK